MKLGVTNIKKLINIGFAFPKQISISLENGWQMMDALDFTDELFELVSVARSWKDIVAEWKDGIDEQERLDLHQHFSEKFDIPNDEVELWIEDAIMHGVITVRMVERFKALRNKN